MARLASQAKNGFHPLAPEAAAGILQHLVPGGEQITILDPCAGEGKALKQLGEGLGVPEENLYAIELNSLRAERLAEAYPKINLLGPCSFMATEISVSSFSLVYCNPPFDDEMGGGGREEVTFVRKSLRLLVKGGVFVLVCPYDQVWGKKGMCELLDTWLEDTEVYLLPNQLRTFKECVVIGRKRAEWLNPKVLGEAGVLHQRGISWAYLYEYRRDTDEIARLGEPQFDQWTNHGIPVALSRRDDPTRLVVPPGRKPPSFSKTGLTDEELEELLQASPLYEKLKTMRLPPLKRPPLSLNKGHTSLVALTGLLDGHVPSNPPHVVRAYCSKKEVLSRTEEKETETAHIEKKVYAEIPQPMVRAVWADGVIRTFGERKESDKPQEEFALVESCEEDEE